ncbi:sensor histidine kinase [Calycomorphotria hydatis]|uniref:sensor histidine kinase n=1 Tax=Calycomorphotria hydatis TaxID=2528027 RepID=UPI0018D260D7|nr:ATP-binding protein [Calycomorphotria hydatis]
MVAALAPIIACTILSFRLTRDISRAEAFIRRPTLQGSSANAGLLNPLINQLVPQLKTAAETIEASARSKSEVEARHHLANSRLQQFHETIDCIVEPIFICDQQERITFANHAAANILKINLETSSRLQDYPELWRLVREGNSRKQATPTRITEFVLGEGDDAITFRARASFLGDGQQEYTVVVLKDIRDEKRDQQQHAKFVSSVSHELKTPMASVRAYTEMLLDGDIETEDERREIYGFIDEQVDRLTRLVNNTLNLARIESGVIPVQRCDCELNDILNKSSNVITQLAEEKKQRFVSELSNLYLAAHVDLDLFEQAIINLLSNAVKYTPEGGTITLQSRLQEDHILIDVRDNGLGIPEESLPHIFERFYRVPGNNAAAPGTGLGLALVHYIIHEIHNGSIEVESEVGKGTCFHVTIPFGHRQRKSASSRSKNNTPRKASPAGQPS